jgi:hypothetical protein
MKFLFEKSLKERYYSHHFIPFLTLKVFFCRYLGNKAKNLIHFYCLIVAKPNRILYHLFIDRGFVNQNAQLGDCQISSYDLVHTVNIVREILSIGVHLII